MKAWILRWLIWLDEGGNVLLGTDKRVPAAGNPHYTISQRLGEMRERGSKTACFLCKILNVVFRTKDHCGEAMQGMPESLDENG